MSIEVLHNFGLLFLNQVFVFLLQLFRQLVRPFLDTANSDLVIAVTFFNVAHWQESWVFHLLLLLLHFFVEFWIQHFKSGNSVVQFRLHGIVADSLCFGQIDVEINSRNFFAFLAKTLIAMFFSKRLAWLSSVLESLWVGFKWAHAYWFWLETFFFLKRVNLVEYFFWACSSSSMRRQVRIHCKEHIFVSKDWDRTLLKDKQFFWGLLNDFPHVFEIFPFVWELVGNKYVFLGMHFKWNLLNHYLRNWLAFRSISRGRLFKGGTGFPGFFDVKEFTVFALDHS